jgi:hypothetical protein
VRAPCLPRAAKNTLICSGEINNQRGQRSRKGLFSRRKVLINARGPVATSPGPANPTLLIIVFVLLWSRIVPAINVVVAETLNLFVLLFKHLGYSIPFLLNLFVFVL